MNSWVVSDCCVLWFQSSIPVPVLSFTVQTVCLQAGSAFPGLGSVMAMQTVPMPLMSIRTVPGDPAQRANSPVIMDSVSYSHTGELGIKTFTRKRHISTAPRLT